MSTMEELMFNLKAGTTSEPKPKKEVVYSERELAASKAVLTNLLANRVLPIVVKSA